METISVFGWDSQKRLVEVQMPVEVVIEKRLALTYIDLFTQHPVVINGVNFTPLDQGMYRLSGMCIIFTPDGRRLDLKYQGHGTSSSFSGTSNRWQVVQLTAEEVAAKFESYSSFIHQVPQLHMEPLSFLVEIGKELQLQHEATRLDMTTWEYDGHTIEEITLPVEAPSVLQQLLDLFPQGSIEVYGRCVRMAVFEGVPVNVVTFRVKSQDAHSKLEELRTKSGGPGNYFYLNSVLYTAEQGQDPKLSIDHMWINQAGSVTATRLALWDLSHGMCRRMKVSGGGKTWVSSQRTKLFTLPVVGTYQFDRASLVTDGAAQGHWRMIFNHEMTNTLNLAVETVGSELGIHSVIEYNHSKPVRLTNVRSYLKSLVLFTTENTLCISATDLGWKLLKTLQSSALEWHFFSLDLTKDEVDISFEAAGFSQEKFWEVLMQMHPELETYQVSTAQMPSALEHLKNVCSFTQDVSSHVLEMHHINLDLESMVIAVLRKLGTTMTGYFRIEGNVGEPARTERVVLPVTVSERITKHPKLENIPPKLPRDAQNTPAWEWWRLWADRNPKTGNVRIGAPVFRVRKGRPQSNIVYTADSFWRQLASSEDGYWDIYLREPREEVTEQPRLLSFSTHTSALFSQQPEGCWPAKNRGILYTRITSNYKFKVLCMKVSTLFTSAHVEHVTVEVTTPDDTMVTLPAYRIEKLGVTIVDQRGELERLQDQAMLYQRLDDDRLYLEDADEDQPQVKVEMSIEEADTDYDKGCVFRLIRNGLALVLKHPSRSEEATRLGQSYLAALSASVGITIDYLLPYLQSHEAELCTLHLPYQEEQLAKLLLTST